MTNYLDRLTDEYLVLRAQEGDAEALEGLLVRWQERFWLLAVSLTTRDTAHDILQESFLAMVRGIGRLEDPACFKSWAYRIVSNKSRDWLRSKQRWTSLRESLSKDGDRKVPVDSASVASDRLALILDGLEDLPSDQRTILKLFYLEGLSVREVAVILKDPHCPSSRSGGGHRSVPL